MILPVVAYGDPILRVVCKDIDKDYPEIQKLIDDMWETMYASNGVGLAGPQINRDIRIFVVDSAQLFEGADEDDEVNDFDDAPGLKQVFINAHIEKLEGEPWAYNEGCLSIPKIREDVMRPESVTIRFMDENFQEHVKTFTGITARIIQHEYDHIEGKLFIDYMKPLKRKLLAGKLKDITKGKVRVDYRMKFPA